jgi:hypothetical protein
MRLMKKSGYCASAVSGGRSSSFHFRFFFLLLFSFFFFFFLCLSTCHAVQLGSQTTALASTLKDTSSSSSPSLSTLSSLFSDLGEAPVSNSLSASQSNQPNPTLNPNYRNPNSNDPKAAAFASLVETHSQSSHALSASTSANARRALERIKQDHTYLDHNIKVIQTQQASIDQEKADFERRKKLLVENEHTLTQNLQAYQQMKQKLQQDVNDYIQYT